MGSFYTYLIEGIDNYNKSFEEYELRWQLLHLVIALECLGFVSNGIKMIFDKKGKPKMCDKADKIINALDVSSVSDRNLITRAYRLRLNAGVTHISSLNYLKCTIRSLS